MRTRTEGGGECEVEINFERKIDVGKSGESDGNGKR